MSDKLPLCYECGDNCNPLRTWPCAKCKRLVCTNCVPNAVLTSRSDWICKDCLAKEEDKL